MKLLRLATSTLLFGAAACGLIVDSSGLTGSLQPDRDAGASDANGVQDANAIDATPDVADAGATKKFCDGRPGAIFCEDFDGPSFDTARVSTKNGSGTVVASSSAPSPPNVFVAQVGALSSGQDGHAVFQPPKVPLQKFHVAFDVSKVGGGTSAIVFDLESSGSGMNFQSELLGDSTFAIYQEFFIRGDGGYESAFTWNGSDTGRTLNPTWQHVDVCFDFTNDTRVLAFDGKKAAEGAGAPSWPATGQLFFGSFLVSGPSTLQEVHIDNVLVDTGACAP